MKAITKKQLKNIKIEADKNGFCVWYRDEMGMWTWIIDGSLVKEDGEINLGVRGNKDIEGIFDEKENKILLKSK